MSENVTIALIGVAGAVVGSLATMAGNALSHWLREKSAYRRDEPRRRLLEEMLEAQNWRKLETLSHVIGADQETTKRLLIEVEARGSEDGQDLWGLVSKNPFRPK